MKYFVCPYGLVMPAPTGVSSVTGDLADPYTVAEDEKTAYRGVFGGGWRCMRTDMGSGHAPISQGDDTYMHHRASHRSDRKRTDDAAAVAAHGVEEVERAGEVVVVVGEGLGHGLAHGLEPREVDAGPEAAVVLEDALQPLLIQQVHLFSNDDNDDKMRGGV